MGLISKIEDKLSSNKGESESSKLQKSGYEDSSSSHLRHPVSSGTTSGGYGSSTTGSSGTHGLGTSGTSATQGYGSSGTSATEGYGSSAAGATGASGMTGSSAMPGSYDGAGSSGVERDGYGQSSSTYDKMGSRDTSGGYGSSTSRTDPRDATTAGGYGSSGKTEAREPYDPYSRSGQATAANAGTGYSSGTSRDDYANDPNIPRSREGGIMNPGSHPASHNPDAIPTAGGQRVGSSDVNDPYSSTTSSSRQDPYSTSTTNSSGHPIRDAAMVGGAGAAAGGAAGYGASRYGDDRSARDPSTAYGQHSSSTNPQDISYMNRSGGATGMDSGMTGSNTMGSSTTDPSMGSTTTSSGMGSSMQQPSGMTGSSNTTGGSGSSMDPRKMGGAYEAGYRDAMEHAKEQMGMSK